MRKASYLLTAVACVFMVSTTSFARHVPSNKDHHVNGQKLLGANLHKNGRHLIHQFGRANTQVTVDVQNGKITGLSASGNATIKKYKSQKAMAAVSNYEEDAAVEFTNDGLESDLMMYDYYIYVGYAVTDIFGDTYIYWFLADIVADPFVDADVYILPIGI